MPDEAGPPDHGFKTRLDSICRSCGGGLPAGTMARSVPTGGYAHVGCGERAGGEGTKPVKANTNLGKVACDAFGTVIARMTPDGWEEVDDPTLVAASTLKGIGFAKHVCDPPLHVPLMERVVEMMDRIGRMGDYVAPDHSGEWWDEPTSDDVWRDGW